MDMLEELEWILGYRFEQRWLLEQALRHGSAREAQLAGSYQRLEFLGDAVLGHAVALLLYDRHRTADEGLLTRMKSYLVRSSSLAGKARAMQLERFVVLGGGEESAAGRSRQALLEDVLEAVIGAIALDGGWDPALRFVTSLFGRTIDHLGEKDLDLTDPKSALQEYAQAREMPLPRYREAAQRGPDHQLQWAFDVELNGRTLARGEGRNKRAAQQNAARKALRRLKGEGAQDSRDLSPSAGSSPPGSSSLQLEDLRQIPGIGPTRLRKLLAALRSPEAVLQASRDELSKVLGPALATRVHRHLHG